MKIVKREVAGGVILCDGSVLLGWKKAESAGVYKNLWIFPGGVVSPLDPTKHELAEPKRRETLYNEIAAECNIGHWLYGRPEPIEFSPPLQDTDTITLREGERSGEEIALAMTHYVYLCELRGQPSDYRHVIRPGDELEKLGWFTAKELPSTPMPRPSYLVLGKIGLI